MVLSDSVNIKFSQPQAIYFFGGTVGMGGNEAKYDQHQGLSSTAFLQGMLPAF